MMHRRILGIAAITALIASTSLTAAQEPPASLRLLEVNTQYETTAPAEHRQFTPTPCVEAAFDEGWKKWLEKLVEPEHVLTRVFEQKFDLPGGGKCVAYLFEHIDEHYIGDDYPAAPVGVPLSEPKPRVFQNAGLGRYVVAKTRQVIPVFFGHFAELDKLIESTRQQHAWPQRTQFVLQTKPY
jgi:hypothetical protein